MPEMSQNQPNEEPELLVLPEEVPTEGQTLVTPETKNLIRLGRVSAFGPSLDGSFNPGE